jgi:hypothetical protein
MASGWHSFFSGEFQRLAFCLQNNLEASVWCRVIQVSKILTTFIKWCVIIFHGDLVHTTLKYKLKHIDLNS